MVNASFLGRVAVVLAATTAVLGRDSPSRRSDSCLLDPTVVVVRVDGRETGIDRTGATGICAERIAVIPAAIAPDLGLDSVSRRGESREFNTEPLETLWLCTIAFGEV